MAQPGGPHAGWYPDRTGHAPLRWWDGVRWTPWESDGRHVWSAPEPDVPGVRPEDLPALDFVRRVFLPQARRRGLLDARDGERLTALADELTDQVGGAGRTARPRPGPAEAAPSWSAPTAAAGSVPVPSPPRPAPSARPTHPPAAHPSPVPGQPVQGPAASPAPTAAPGRFSQWWARLRRRPDADLTVHGLAYLGVLLLFVGVFGLVAFAFGDVTPALRPVAALAVAVVPFASAVLLRRSGARWVARTMESLGGLLLPLMVVTSTVDGYPVPPDLHGAALPVTHTVVCAALAGGYALWSRSRPDTGLRVMVAPVLWLGAAMAAIGLGRPVPTGEDVAVPAAAQIGVVALAVLATTLVARRSAVRPGGIADGALRAALPGTVVVLVLAVVGWLAEGWPVLPVLVTSAAVALTWDRLPRVPGRVSDVALAVVWWLVLLRVATVGRTTPWLSPDVPGPPPADGAVALLLLLVLLAGVALAETVGRRARSAVAAVLLPAGVLVAAFLLLAHDGWSVAGAVVVLAWVVARRVRPYAVPGARGVLDVVAAVAPVVLVLALGASAGLTAALAGAAAVLLAATVLARGLPASDGVLRRSEIAPDRFWRRWWLVAFPGVLLLQLGAVGAGRLAADAPVDRWAVPVAAALLAVAAASGPVRALLRVALTTVVLWWAWLTAAAAAGAGDGVRGGVLAVAALLAVVVTVLPLGSPTGRWTTGSGRRVRAAIASAGHVSAVVALAAGGPGRPLVVGLACLSAGWLVTALATDRGASPLGLALDRRGDVGRLGPWVVVLLAVPGTLWTALHVEDVLPVTDPWTTAVLMGTAVVYGLLTRVVRSGRVTVLLPWVAFAAALLGPLLSWREWPLVAALGVVVVQVLLTRPRAGVMVWTAWGVLSPLVALALHTGLPTAQQLGGPALLAATTTGLGGLLAVGALAVDRARPREPRLLPRRSVAVPPAVVGAVNVLVGLVAAWTVRDPAVAGVLLLAGAAVVATLAVLSGVGAVGGIGVVLAWAGTVQLLGGDWPGAWGHVVVATGVLASAHAVALLGPPRHRWARWDVPVALAAVPPALVAVLTAAGPDRPLVLTVVGVLSVGAAVRLRSRRRLSESLGWVGTFLVLLGAVDAGSGWTAVALVVLSASHTALAAVREQGTVRRLRQGVGVVAAVAAWGATLVASGWTAQQATDVTATGAAVLAVALVLASRAGVLGRSWLVAWGAGTVVVGLVAGLRLLPDPQLVARRWYGPDLRTLEVLLGPFAPSSVVASGWQVLGLVLLGAAVALAAGPLARSWGRDVGLLLALLGVLTAFTVTSAGPLAQVSALVGLAVVASAALVLLPGGGQADGVRARGARDGAGPDPDGAVRRAGPGPWSRPLAVLAGAALAVALLGTLVRSVDGRPSDAPVLLLLAACAAGVAVLAGATGLVWRALGLRLLSPVIAWAAWAAYWAEVLSGQVAWFTVPVGLALLVVVAVWRADRRARGLDPAERTVVSLELTGVAFLVVASFGAALTESVLHALAAAGIGVLVALWGLLTRVRRRLTAGVGIVLAGVVLAVAVPLVALLPAWGGAGTWILVAGVGLLAVLAATFLERGRTAVRGGRRRVHELTEGWE